MISNSSPGGERIDIFVTDLLAYDVQKIAVCLTPFTDHQSVIMNFRGKRQRSYGTGYWKLNVQLLKKVLLSYELQPFENTGDTNNPF